MKSIVIDAGGVKALAQALAGVPVLEHLNLSGARIQYEEMRILILHLSRLQFLQCLDLSCNEVGDNGAMALAPSFAHLNGLKELYLVKHFMRPNGIISLAAGLTALTAFEHLHLSGNGAGPAGMQALARTLPHFMALESLQLESCCMTNQAQSGAIRRNQYLNCT